LAWALERYAYVETVSFDYGQRHRIELNARLKVLAAIREQFPLWRAKLGEDHLVDLTVLGAMSDTALTSGAEIKMTSAGLPNTFVPGRNLLFLTFASALGYRRELNVMVGGMCETDFSGYPDCRDDTVKALQVAVSLGMGQRFTFETPLMWIDKAATWGLAHSLGGDALVKIILEESHTCYLGERGQRHAWGYGCGQCPACALRKAGYERWVQSHP
jgi:7-cyano-7-deazaguanine synthase